MDSNDRRARILELEAELKELRIEEALERASNSEGVLEYCSKLKKEGETIKAIKYYREMFGTGLLEAKNVVDTL